MSLSVAAAGVSTKDLSDAATSLPLLLAFGGGAERVLGGPRGMCGARGPRETEWERPSKPGDEPRLPAPRVEEELSGSACGRRGWRDARLAAVVA